MTNALLDTKTAIVTGVGVGLGREVAAALLDADANVVVAARSAERLAAVADELDPSGDRILAHPADINDETSCQALVDGALNRFGSST